MKETKSLNELLESNDKYHPQKEMCSLSWGPSFWKTTLMTLEIVVELMRRWVWDHFFFFFFCLSILSQSLASHKRGTFL